MKILANLKNSTVAPLQILRKNKYADVVQEIKEVLEDNKRFSQLLAQSQDNPKYLDNFLNLINFIILVERNKKVHDYDKPRKISTDLFGRNLLSRMMQISHE